jgi:hypothetical protein
MITTTANHAKLVAITTRDGFCCTNTKPDTSTEQTTHAAVQVVDRCEDH